MPVLDDIKGFVTVAETGGFTHAARKLAISTSVVSRRIDRLETELGVCLMLRNTRGVTLTPAGNEFYRRAQLILRELDNAYQAVAERKEEITGCLHISTPYSFGIRHLEPVLNRLSTSYPTLEFDISYNDRYVDLLKESFDAVIRIGAISELSFAARRIGPIPTVLVASPAYLEKHGTLQTPNQISEHQCLIYSGRTHAEWVFQRGENRWALLPAGRFYSDSGEVLLKWALSGRGIAVFPHFMVKEALSGGGLVRLLPDYAMPEHDLYILRPPGVRVAGKVRVLFDEMVAYCRDALQGP
ncbi:MULTISPECIES: LysR family transcriptional regulator [Sodalis]|uniref:LysR family transcriptional regulator n=1 Tax=Sodalis ligni TaxID=2697027 RepID=A0A4V6NFL0_9GAMM|nr:LysR family transcriptional regulator [Sodalis ligni]TCL02138.1 LysR family transcriptional regulator [Sodalis ligni]